MRIVERKTLAKLLADRLAQSQIIAPVQIDGRLYFRLLDPGRGLKEMVWPAGVPAGDASPDGAPGGTSTGDPLTVNSIKEFFFPRRQELYEQRPEGIIDRSAPIEKNRLLVFVRPCEARALTILDRVFLEDYRDDSYAAFRENTTIVGLNCLEPDPHCFCVSLGGSPFGSEGIDLSLTQIEGGRFLANPVSEKGQALLDSLPGRKAGEQERQLLEKLRSSAEAAVRRTVQIPEVQSMAEHFDSDYWREVSRACITCGVCSYLCPTCHCFDIVDEGYLRVRCWDTCSSDTFTRMAAGEDQRRQKHTRYRQRVYHKFSYFRENFEMVACVGCGRCTRHCPVKIDIVEIVNGIAGLGRSGGVKR